MDREVVEQKLESLRRCLQRIETKCPADAATLDTDADLQDIVSLNLSRAVQIAVDIGAHLIASMEVSPPDTMGQTFDVLAQQGVLRGDLANNLKKAVGFRNIAVHNYESINWNIVHRIAKCHLVDFSEFAKVVMLKLEKQ
ncbi:MAG: type VII toxin-antitoxin system HepT family RNase toxin [Pseudomonadota bacterium]